MDGARDIIVGLVEDWLADDSDLASTLLEARLHGDRLEGFTEDELAEAIFQAGLHFDSLYGEEKGREIWDAMMVAFTGLDTEGMDRLLFG